MVKKNIARFYQLLLVICCEIRKKMSEPSWGLSFVL